MRKKRLSKQTVDLILLSVIAVVSYLLAAHFDLFERITDFTEEYEHLELDEIITMVLILSFFIIIFMIRRWIEHNHRAEILKELSVKQKQQLRKNKLLMKEIHHRVKNNLQLVASLLSLQKSTLEDQQSRELLENCRKRILTIGDVHKQLYDHIASEKIDAKLYIEELGEKIKNLYKQDKTDVSVKVRAEKFFFSPETAIACGIIINELMTNSFKYAFKNGPGEISVFFEKDGSSDLCLRILDNGVGFKNSEPLEKTKSLGLIIVKSMAEGNLKGSIKKIEDRGTEWIITFPRES